MQVINCRKCGKLFNHLKGAPICKNCAAELEEKFRSVKEYIYDNPGADVQTVSQEMDVKINMIYRWVKEEKLQFSEQSGFGLPCEVCGGTITIGRYCDQCKAKLANGFSGLYKKQNTPQQQESETHGSRMRFFE